MEQAPDVADMSGRRKAKGRKHGAIVVAVDTRIILAVVVFLVLVLASAR